MGTRARELPIDRGWAWVVLAASTLEFFVMVGFLKGFGLLFVEYIIKYDATSSSISLAYAMQTLFYSLFSVFVLGIGTSYFKTRTLVISGALILTVSQISNAFAPSDAFLVFSQGFLFGTGAAFMHGPATLMLGVYFEKRRGLSNSVANIGGSVGGLIFPPMIRVLLDEFGLTGCLILLSGFFLNCVICGALMRPINISERTKELDKEMSFRFSEVNNSHNETPDVLRELLNEPIVKNTNKVKQLDKSVISYETKVLNGHSKLFQSYEQLHASPAAEYSRRRTVSESVAGKATTNGHAHEPHLERNLELYGSFGDGMGSFTAGNSVDVLVTEKEESDPGSNSFDQSDCNDCTSKIFDCSLMRHALFLLFMGVSFLAVPSCGLPVNYLPPWAKDFNIPDDDVAWLVTISGSCDIFSRCVLAFIADNKKIKRHVLVAVCLFLNGLGCLFASLYTTFTTFIIYAMTYGFFGGIYFTLYPVVIVDFIGVEKLKYGLATTSVLTGISISIFSVLVGSIRDSTGSYVNGVYMYGILGMVSATCLLVFQPICSRVQKKREAQSNV